MADDLLHLLPPIGAINRRLTEIAREQKRLRTLLAIAVEARKDAETFSGKSKPTLDLKG